MVEHSEMISKQYLFNSSQQMLIQLTSFYQSLGHQSCQLSQQSPECIGHNINNQWSMHKDTV
jgi:hypothetical protein